MRSRKAQCQGTTGQPRNRRYIRVSQQSKTKLRSPENSIEHQNVHGRRSSSSSASIYISVYTSETDFHKPGIYGGRVRVRATEGARWSRSPGCCGYISWCVFLVSGGISCLFFRFLYFERTRPTASTRQPCLMYLSTSTGVRTACHYLISPSVCLCICQCV